MMFVLFGSLALLAISFAIYIKIKQNYWNTRNIPHLKPTFFLGNVGDRHWSFVFEEIYKKFKGTGPFAGYYLFTKPGVVVLEPELAKDILIKDFHNFEDRGLFYNERDDPLTGNLFFLDGEKWRQLRHKLSPVFTSGKMKHMFHFVLSAAQELNSVTHEKFSESKSKTLEITDLLGRFTSDVIGVCAFGLNCNGLRNPKAEFVVMGKTFFTDQRHGQLVSGLIFQFPDLARRLGACILSQATNDFYIKLVRETIEYREMNNIKRNDFMDMLIEMKSDHVIKDAQGQSVSLTVEEIAAQAFVFLVAGFETSATTMSFVLYELAQNISVQDKLREEVKMIFEKHENTLTYESMSEMKYLECVVNETLRKHPIVSQIMRKTRSRYETSDKRYFIEAGTTVFIPPIGFHHDPTYFPEPEKFKPERFTPEEIQNRPACCFLPFGEGPRNCIGMRFAKMQIYIGLAYLIKDFEFSVAPETQIPYTPSKLSFTVTPENGIHLKVNTFQIN